MKKLNKKKIVYLVILIVIVGFLLTMYNNLNGNPISKAIAKGKIQRYIEETYPDKDFNIDKMGYNFKFTNYYATVISEEAGLNFSIDIRRDNSFWDEYKEEPVLVDHELSKRFRETIEGYTKEDISDVVMFMDDNSKEKINNYLFAELEVPQGKYRDKDIQYSTDMDDPFIFSVSLYPENGDNYKKELLSVAKALKNSINKRAYNGVVGMYVNIGWDNTSYCIVINKDELKISDEELENYIQEGTASYKGAYGNYEISVNTYTK